MKTNLKKIINEVVFELTPPSGEIEFINSELRFFLEKIRRRILKLKIDAEVFVGGSYAKNTLVKGKFYDVDLFLRFGKTYLEKDYFKVAKKILSFVRRKEVVHGSREYFRIPIGKKVFFEVVPVKKIKSPKDAVNITDLSYSHVQYINKKIKKKEVLDGIKLAKVFCKAQKVYGAESYVNGFSGYALELLIYHFGSFEKFLRELVKKRNKKLVIDVEKLYKTGNVLLDMNGSKLDSPIVLVDPTYKARNVLAALSQETFRKFQEGALKFLKNPSKEFFVVKEIDFDSQRASSKKSGDEFLGLEIRTSKQEGDIAGTKLLKFFNHLSSEFERNFKVKEKDFEYSSGKTGRGYFILKSLGEIKFSGPPVKDKKNLLAFKKEHYKTFEKGGKIYAVEKVIKTPREFLKNWLNKNKRKVKEMGITGVVCF